MSNKSGPGDLLIISLFKEFQNDLLQFEQLVTGQGGFRYRRQRDFRRAQVGRQQNSGGENET